MTPVRSRLTACALALAVATIGMGGLSARNALAQASEDLNDTVQIRGKVLADRMAILREEFKERQQEAREARERAAHSKKKSAHGRKAEPAVNDDYYAGSGVKRVFPQTQVAPTNVKANDKTADGVGAGQAEQHIAMLGTNGLAAWNDGQGFNVGPDVQGYGWTINSGASWTDGGVPAKGGTIT